MLRFILIVLLSLFSVFAQAEPSNVRPVGVSDPAAKRGLELGYDMGRKAGKQDMAESRPSQSKEHEYYKNANTYHRTEYGSLASFENGFKKGFVIGYESAYKGERPTQIKLKKSHSDFSDSGLNPPPSKTRHVNTLEDAL